MNAQPNPTSNADASVCPLCGVTFEPGALRCAECGYTLAGVTGDTKGYSRTALLWTIAAFVAIYVVTIAIVAATR